MNRLDRRDRPRLLMCSIALLTAVPLLAGCATRRSPGVEDLFLAHYPAQSPVSIHDVFPRHGGAALFADIPDVDASSDSRERIVIEISEPDGDGAWTTTYARRGDPTPLRADTLVLAPDGGVRMTRSISYDRDSMTTYDPPLIIMPPELEPSAPVEQTVLMRVHPVDDEETVRQRGEATQRLEFTGVQSVRTGAGVVEAYMLVSEFIARLPPARVEARTVTWYAPDASPIGIIAERYDEKLFIFGVPSSSRGHVWIFESSR